ncbi:MAG: DUF2207 domain-containing protein [Candidatus Eisenbacteria bacterium]|uniref:DUF2207 domain-containing protein n=1 Tax=Eiseniibacteriota bacterium TaxID=2212470 RepID=A0A7Y2H2E6_UNCEI|nr:DUF2207 domain-containing protein [Candidatus Eisenbacteria bacterium]
MKWTGFLLLTLVLCGSLLSPIASLADRGGFVIESFETDLTVRSDAILEVEERIVVDFSESRHGIYRDIPIRYTDPMGYTYSLGLKLHEVVDEEGQKYKTKSRNKNRYRSIRIGSPNFTVNGRVTYIIRYTVERALGDFETHDELYWNATGNEWRTSIRKSIATVHLPEGFEVSDLETAGYTGRFGSKDQNVRITHPDNRTIRFETRGALEPMEGLTVVAAWPPGYVDFPTSSEIWLSRLLLNWIGIAPFAFFVFLWRRYQRLGKDPDPGPIMVRYEPPPDMTPGEIGAIVDERVDLRDITATVVDLAIRGYLKINMKEKKGFLSFRGVQPEFESLKKADVSLRSHEQQVLNALFEKKNVVGTKDLKHKFYRSLPGIKNAVQDALVEKKMFRGKPSSIIGKQIGLGFLMGLLVFGVGALWSKIMGAYMPHGLIIPIASGVATLILFISFSSAMPQRTKKGATLRSWALGFEEFIDRVETENLERSRAKHVFESLLPYAMALGVADKWAEQFENLYDQGSPGWFHGRDAFHSTSNLEDSLRSVMHSASKSMSSAPRSSSSSGSGGGGFSGGGGGGGGGGSW